MKQGKRKVTALPQMVLGRFGFTPRTANMLTVAALCIGLSGCGGGGGGSATRGPDQPAPPQDDQDPVVPQPTPTPDPEMDPEPVPQPTPEPEPELACLTTADFGCLSPTDYQQRRTSLAQGFRVTEAFSNQWGLSSIRADVAYAEIALRYGQGSSPGQGQTIGIIDTGIDQDHPVFAGKTIFEQFRPGATDEIGDESSHGTAVASVIAGEPSVAYIQSVQGTQGVAPGADLAMFAIPLGLGGGLYRPVSLTALNRADSTSAALYNAVTAWSQASRELDFVNMSFGYGGIIDQYSASDLRSNFGQTIAALAQAGSSEKTVFIVAAGNGHGRPCNTADFAAAPGICVGSNQTGSGELGDGRINARAPGILAGLPALLPELRGHMIAVAAVAPDTDGSGSHEIASFSNRCGIAAQWCLAAPGQQVRAAYFGPHPNDGMVVARGAYSPSGTSLAAPMVTGSLAVMKHAFRSQLSNRDLVTRLLTTANNRGLYSNSAIYGRGLLDLGAALTPVGPVSVMLGAHVNAPGIAVSQTGFRPGRALGNGFTRGLSGKELAVFDTLGAPFWIKLDTMIGQTARPTSTPRLWAFMTLDARSGTFGGLQPGITMLRAEQGRVGNGWYMGQLQSARAGFAGGHLSLADRALALGIQPSPVFSITAFSTEGTYGLAPVSGTTLSWQPESLPLGFRSGLATERQTFLGSQLTGAFGVASAHSVFFGADWRGRLKRWTVHAEAEIGRADAAVQGGMIENVTPLISSAFALRARRPLADGTLHLSLAQPLRVESGKARLSVPIGRSTDGQVLHRSVPADLAPDGRQIDISAQWNRSFGRGQDLRMGVTWTRHPGHDATASPELVTMAGWKIRF